MGLETQNVVDSSVIPPEPSREIDNFFYQPYTSEEQLKWISALIYEDLTEPYSIYTYRYFLNEWPDLCWLVTEKEKNKCIAAIVCKQDLHTGKSIRGYIAMLVVDKEYRGRGIGSNLVIHALEIMKKYNCEEVVLETEASNFAALKLYQNLGFIKDKRLLRYYINGADAWRLKLCLAYD